ncbi:MAG: OFA family MFS transporter [Spirochaetes bacterium]|nr:OFA family MFS transporter [Spirochaetota bacterium]
MSSRQGLYAVIASVAIQLTFGIAYIWSIFQTGVANSIFGGNNAAAGLTFSLLLAMLTFGSVIGGKLAHRFSSRVVVFIGGIILSSGFFIASFTTEAFFWLLWVSYGVMGGLGMGFTYSTTIACVQKWYPHKKGLVSGIVVSAIGLGSVIFAPVVEILISNFGGRGIGEPKTFMVLSAIFLIVCTIGSIFIKNPPDGYMTDKVAANKAAAAVKSYTSTEMLKTPQFYLITITFLFACMGGLMMIGFAKPITEAKGLVETAVIAVLAVSVTNSIGRVLWGMISDKIGRINTVFILLFGTAVLSLLVNVVAGYWIFVLIALIGLFFGGMVGTFPALTADLFGPKHMATNYGFVLLGFGLGAIISSQIAGYYKNIAVHDISLMFPAFLIASCCAAAGLVMMMVLKVMQRRQVKSGAVG